MTASGEMHFNAFFNFTFCANDTINYCWKTYCTVCLSYILFQNIPSELKCTMYGALFSGTVAICRGWLSIRQFVYKNMLQLFAVPLLITHMYMI